MIHTEHFLYAKQDLKLDNNNNKKKKINKYKRHI